MELPGGRVAETSGRRLLDGTGGKAIRRSGGLREEQRLVEQASRGDPLAFEALFRAHRDQVYGLAMRLTGDPELAQEILLDSFVAAWTGLRTFRGDSRFSTWISSIAVNHSRQAHRAKNRRLQRFEALEAVEAPVSCLSADGTQVEDCIDVERAIAKLPPGAREALILRHVHGLSCAETAAVLNVTVGTVKSQTSRACALLRERLSHD